MEKQKSKTAKVLALSLICLSVIAVITVFAVLLLNSTSPAKAADFNLDDWTNILSKAKDLFGADHASASALQTSINKYNIINGNIDKYQRNVNDLIKSEAKPTQIKRAQNILKEEQDKLKPIEDDITAKGDILKKEVDDYKKVITDRKNKFMQDPWDLVFNLLSAARAGFLTFDTLSAHGGAGDCVAETPIKGNDLCKTCDEDPYRICTQERCTFLGTSCVAVPTNKTGQYRCEKGPCQSIGDIHLTRLQANWFTDTSESPQSPLFATPGVGPSGTIVLDLNQVAAHEIEWNTKTIVLKVETEELAQCRFIIDKAGANFSEMTDFNNNDYPEAADGSPLPQEGIVALGGEISRGTNHTIYIKCNNVCNFPHEPTYDYNQVRFKLGKKPDQLPPEIVFIDPASNSVVRNDTSYINASFWLDEKGYCKFSDKSTNYTLDFSNSAPVRMQLFGNYDDENSSVEAGGCYTGKCLDRNVSDCSRCWLKLNLSKGYDVIPYNSSEFNETKFFNLRIRCSDVGADGIVNTHDDNLMTEDSVLDYSLMTAPGYNISIIEPTENTKTYDTSPEIQVTSEPRITQCKYKVYTGSAPLIHPSWDNMTFIDEEASTAHVGKIKESLNGTPTGKDYTIYVLCRDTWHIEEDDFVAVKILRDTAAPVLIRTYHDSSIGDFLIAETDDVSSCTYSLDTCNFNISIGVPMTGDNSTIHAAYWDDKTFYIKCIDIWGNAPTPTACTAILRPFEVPSL